MRIALVLLLYGLAFYVLMYLPTKLVEKWFFKGEKNPIAGFIWVIIFTLLVFFGAILFCLIYSKMRY